MLNAEISWLDAVKRNEDKYYKKGGMNEYLNELLNNATYEVNTMYRQNEIFGQGQVIMRAANNDAVLMTNGQGEAQWVNHQRLVQGNLGAQMLYQVDRDVLAQQQMAAYTQMNHQQHVNLHQGVMLQEQHTINGQNYGVITNTAARIETVNNLIETGLITPDQVRDMFRYVAMEPIMEDAEHEPDLDGPFDDEGEQHD